MSTIQIPPERGGSGTMWSDERGAPNTMRAGGYITRLFLMLADVIGLGNWFKNYADTTIAIVDASAVSAAASAASAVNAPGTSGTSTTSHNITTGSKTFTMQAAKNFVAGMRLTIANTASPGNALYAYVNSYNSGTGSLVVTVDGVSGSGSSITTWTISLSAATPIGAMELVSVATASNSATIDFTNLDSAYDYRLIGSGIRLATNAARMRLRTSTNNGSSYNAGASDYESEDGSKSYVAVSQSLSNSNAAYAADIDFMITNIGSASLRKLVTGRSTHPSDEPFMGIRTDPIFGSYVGATSAINAFRIFASSGNISVGAFQLYRIKRS